MSIAGILRSWVLVSAFAGVLALLLVPGVRAQSVSSSPAVSPAGVGSIQPVPMPPSPSPNQPVPMAPSAGPLNPADFRDTSATGMGTGPMIPADSALIVAPAAVAGTAPVTPPAAPLHSPTGLSVLDVISESLFGEIYSPAAQGKWSPLTLGTFFSEGWDVPYVNPTAGDGGLADTGGAPRQGWVNAFGGSFYRAWFFAFAYDQGVNSHIGNGYLGRYEIFIPFNRRFEFEIRWDFIVSNKGGTSNTYHGNIGQTGFVGRWQLSESKNFGQTFHLGFFAPTGRQENGNGVASVQPWYQFWWNAYDKWVLKGETGVTVPTNHALTSGYSTYHNLLALGRYFPGSKESWFQQWWFYLVADAESTIAGTPRRFSSFSLLPGMRCRMTGRVFENLGTGLWYFFASVNVPMTGPQAFSYQPIFAVLYDY